MKTIRSGLARLSLSLALSIPATSWGSTIYTQLTGTDGTSCGPDDSPCRTISRAITNAADGDTIAIGPGRYGSVNGDSDLADSGEEVSGVSGKMIVVDKQVSLIALAGSGTVVISGKGVSGLTTLVSIESNGVTFGKKGKAFYVEELTSATGSAVTVDSATSDVVIGGNTFHYNTLNSLSLDGTGNKAKENSFEGKVKLFGSDNVVTKNTLRNCTGSMTIDGSGHVISSNRLIQGGVLVLAATSNALKVSANELSGDCGSGPALQILGGANHEITGNLLTGRDSAGIDVSGGSDNVFIGNISRTGTYGFHVVAGTNLTFIGNLASGNAYDGFFIQPSPPTNIVMQKNTSIGNTGRGFSISQTLTTSFTGNSAIGNGDEGIFILGAATIDGNNIFGNGVRSGTTNPNCGLVQGGISLADASNNYWGSPTGPGATDPADNVCLNTTYIDSTSPAVAPFKIKPPKADPY